jgi:hypothetical protein
VKKIKYIGSKPVNQGNTPSFSFFNNTSNTIFSGELNITSNLTGENEVKREKRIIITQKNITLSKLDINLNELNNIVKTLKKLKLNIDLKNVATYSSYGSLKELFRVSINNIINNFPAGLGFLNVIDDNLYFNVLDYTYNEFNKKSTFKIPFIVIDNPFNINLNENTSIDLVNFKEKYFDYQVVFNNEKYNITNFTGYSSTNSSYIFLEVSGDVFGSLSSSTISEIFYIKPKDDLYLKYYNNLTEIEQYIIGKNDNYNFTLKIPLLNDNDELILNEIILKIPKSFYGYNLDTTSYQYEYFLEKLFEIGDLYDEYKSNFILRKLIPSNIIDFDNTNEFKIESLLKIYGNKIDEIKKFIDSLMYINNVSYDKINNISDVLIKNLASSLTWKAKSILDGNDLINSIFTVEDSTTKTSINEIDIELWRRIVINTNWFFQSKGTRKALETIFYFIGAPDCLFNINEHVYVAEAPINIESEFNDIEGYPTFPIPDPLTYYQQNGIEDGGFKFMERYRNLGYNITKIIDNKKSWVQNTGFTIHSSTNRNTNYTVNDTRLIINTKEVNIDIDPAKGIECDVYNYNLENNKPVISTGASIPYPQRESNKINVTNLTFGEYVNEIYSKFINAQNRKVAYAANDTHYPSLTKLYYDYFNYNDSNKRNFSDLLKYVDNIDILFNDFIEKLIPATTIFTGGATSIRNTIFTPQKYSYKHGIDDGSEFVTENILSITNDEKNTLLKIESEFTDTLLDNCNLLQITSEINVSDDENIDTEFFTNAKQNINLDSKFNSKICDVDNIEYVVTGVTKIELSSFTNNSLHNKSNNNIKEIIFELTGNTDNLTANTSNFYYYLYNYNYTLNIFNENPILMFKADYSALTSNTIISTINSNNLLCDTEYIIKPFFEFVVCPNIYEIYSAYTPYNIYEDFIYNNYFNNYSNSERFFNYLNFIPNTGTTISTFENINEYNPLFGLYNTNTDYYFASICNPDKPLFNIFTDEFSEGLYIENIPVNNTIFSSFTTTFEPIGDIIVSVNGLTLQKDIEYSNNLSITIPSFQKRSFILNQRLTSLHADTLTVSYYRSNINTTKLVTENFDFDTTTSITFNISTNFYEIALNNIRIPNSDLLLYYNGLLLQQNVDFVISSFNDNIIVLLFNPEPDSVFVVYYLTNSIGTDDLIEPTGSFFDLNWRTDNIVENRLNGFFELNFFELTNPSLTGTPIYQIIVPYNFITNIYNYVFYWLNTGLLLGNIYYFQIKSIKSFTTINNVVLTTINTSDRIRIKIPL